MDENVYEQVEMRIRAISKTVEGVIEIEKCHVRKAGLHYYIDLHLVVDAMITVRKGHEIAHDLKDHLMREIPELADVLIHVEPHTF
jgi:divalent metal cation (Fe/Co/Zn/Cd) transporter